MRKSPIRHKVKTHTRKGKKINSFIRGSGVHIRNSKVVGTGKTRRDNITVGKFVRVRGRGIGTIYGGIEKYEDIPDRIYWDDKYPPGTEFVTVQYGLHGEGGVAYVPLSKISPVEKSEIEAMRGVETQEYMKDVMVGKNRKQRVYSLIGVERDSRYSPSVRINYRNSIRDTINYLTGKSKVIGQASNDKYTVRIIESIDKDMKRQGRNLVTLNSRPDEPVPTGFWMDLPEKHWGISDSKYYNLSRKERANMEAQEQLDMWVPKQFYSNWLDFYAPKIYDKKFWLGELENVRTHAEKNEKSRRIVESIW